MNAGNIQMNQHYIIRSLQKEEVILLKDFLYEAIFLPEGAKPPAREIVERPELRVYTDGFGSQKGDNCLVAEIGGRVVGAVWTRIMEDYGHIDNDIPSFAISLYQEYRGQGIGTELIQRVKKVVKLPVIAGSGVNARNIGEQLKIADGAIIGSSLKEGGLLSNPISGQLVKEVLAGLGR